MIKNLLKGNILLLIVYFIAGQITLNLSITPSGATPLWVPAGIALGAILIWGYRLLPAVFIGDFLIAQQMLGLNDPTSVALCIAIGFQAVLHAWIAKFLLVRFKFWPTSLMHDRDIIYFFLISGLVATFFSAAFIISVEFFYRMLDISNWLNSFIVWWVGNALGVILFTPIVLILFASPRANWRMRKANVGLPMLMLFLVLLLALNFSKTNERQQISSFFNSNVNMAHALVVSEIALHKNLLKSMRAYFQNSIYVTPEEFRGYLEDYSHSGLDDIYVIGWIEYVKDADRIFFESQYGYQIVDFDRTEKRFITAPQRAAYYVSKYMHTSYSRDAQLGNNFGQGKGFDFCFDKQRASLCQYMQETGQAVVMPTFFKEIGSNANDRFMALLPVFSKSKEMIGIVEHAYEYKKFFNVLLDSATKQWLELEITDITISDTPLILFKTQPHPNKQEAVKFFSLLETRIVDIGNRRWQFTYRPSLYFEEHYALPVFYWVIIGTFFV